VQFTLLVDGYMYDKAILDDGASEEYCVVSGAGEFLQGCLVALCCIGSVFIEVLDILSSELYGFGYFDVGERVRCRSCGC
jgi:hypothetical protein